MNAFPLLVGYVETRQGEPMTRVSVDCDGDVWIVQDGARVLLLEDEAARLRYLLEEAEKISANVLRRNAQKARAAK